MKQEKKMDPYLTFLTLIIGIVIGAFIGEKLAFYDVKARLDAVHGNLVKETK